MRSDSPTRSRLCKLACETPILDICDVERNPKYENARYTLERIFFPPNICETKLFASNVQTRNTICVFRSKKNMKKSLQKYIYHTQHPVPLGVALPAPDGPSGVRAPLSRPRLDRVRARGRSRGGVPCAPERHRTRHEGQPAAQHRDAG